MTIFLVMSELLTKVPQPHRSHFYSIIYKGKHRILYLLHDVSLVIFQSYDTELLNFTSPQVMDDLPYAKPQRLHAWDAVYWAATERPMKEHLEPVLSLFICEIRRISSTGSTSSSPCSSVRHRLTVCHRCQAECSFQKESIAGYFIPQKGLSSPSRPPNA